MHGRKKKEGTPDEEAARQKERVKKVSGYRYAMGIIFKKRANKELDEELLKVTGQVLASNPDIMTLWNIRREVLTILKENDYDTFLEKVVPKELEFAEFCLKNNPKSYGAWHHRYWLMKQTNFSKVASELKLLAKYLEYDDRNFHCWDYRRFLLENCSEVTLEQEFEFTTEKISSNFSNFSSWHLRSKLLPKLSKDYLTDELELIRNAVFTDPQDQSAWFYHRWLLKSQLSAETPSIIGVQLRDSKLVVIFHTVVPNPSQMDIKIDCDDNCSNCCWTNPWSNTSSKLWEYTFPNKVNSILLHANENVMRNMDSTNLKVNQGDVIINFPRYFDAETQVKSEKLLILLKEELAWVQELQDLEPDIKWPISTLIMLMRMTDFAGYKQDILKNLEKLMKLDTKRINYYFDLRSKYMIEWKLLEDIKSPSRTLQEKQLDLSGLGLTALYYPERMCFHLQINLSGNTLKNAEPFRALLNCNEVDISGNKLSEHELKSAINELRQLKL